MNSETCYDCVYSNYDEKTRATYCLNNGWILGETFAESFVPTATICAEFKKPKQIITTCLGCNYYEYPMCSLHNILIREALCCSCNEYIGIEQLIVLSYNHLVKSLFDPY